MNFEITKSGEKYTGRVFSVDQGNAEIPLSKVEFNDRELVIEADSVGARFVGTLNPDESIATGKWTQRGNEIDFTINRVESFDVPKLIESWKGTLDAGSVKLEMGLQIYKSRDGSLSAKLDSYSQGATGIPVKLKREGDKYVVTHDAMKMRYVAILNKDKSQLEGTFEQAGNEIPLVMEKTVAGYKPEYKRPQIPKGPIPYESSDVTFENPGDKLNLAGTLTTPRGAGPFPAAILISGSGPQDRDESILGHKPFLVIADYLTRQGVAVLRFDDRGVADSTGNFAIATTEDFARDVQSGIDFLKTQKKIDASKIGLVGHSEGGLIAPMVASERDDVAFIVLLAGPGVDGATILVSQTRAMLEAGGADQKTIDANKKVFDALFKLIHSKESVTADEITKVCKDVVDNFPDERTRETMEASLAGLGTKYSSPWMMFFIKHDPAEVLARVSCPILAINGEKDLQVLADLNLDAIRQALTDSGHSNFEIVRLPGMNHLFQETDGPGLPGEYAQIEQTFSPKAMEVVGKWLHRTLKQ